MSLAAIKRRLQVGAKIEMVAHDWHYGEDPVPPKLAGVREVAKVQSNAVQFTGGSWLYWPAANRVRLTPKGFDVALKDDGGAFDEVMSYEWRD